MRSTFSSLLATLLLTAALADAATIEDAAALEEELVVIGTLEETIPMKLASYGNRMEIITADDIELSGFNDLGQTLQMLVPGLYLAPKNGAFDYMNCSLQGSRCQDILWLIDGVRINNRLYNSTSPLDTVPAHMVERIEVLYGGQGIFYGTQSVAGVVNVVTKPFSTETTGSIGAGFDENDGYQVNAEYRTSVGRNQFVVYGSIDDSDGFQPFSSADYQPSGTDRDRGYEVTTIGAKYAIELTDAARLSLLYHRTDNEVEWASPANRNRSYNEREEDLFTLKLDYRLSDDIDLYVKGYYHDWDSRWTRRDNELDDNGQLTGNIILVSDEEYWGYEDYGVTAVTDIRTQHGLDYSLGLDHQSYSGRDDVLLIADDTEDVNAAFVQVRTSRDLLEDTQIALGVRHNRPSGDGDITVWNLSGKHSFTDSFYVRGSAGTAFRSPDAWQLYGNDPCCTLGNPDLEGEESENFNLAIGGTIDFARGLSWELIGFTREVDNLIGSENGMRVNTSNSVDFDGFEVTLKARLRDDLTISFDYVITNAEEDGSSDQIADVPEDLLKANLTYRPSDLPVEFTTSVIRIGDLYDSVSGGIGRVEHGDYTVVDIGAAWYIDAARHHRVGARLENAFDEDYGSSLGRAFRDSDDSSYAYTNLGTPRTWHVSYRFSF